MISMPGKIAHIDAGMGLARVQFRKKSIAGSRLEDWKPQDWRKEILISFTVP